MKKKLPLSPRALAYGGLLTAVIAVLTAFVRLYIPMAYGYAHLGDAAIVLAGLLLGPAAWLPAALGSALGDLFLGYAIYAPFSFVIKGVMGFLAGRFLSWNKGLTVNNVLILLGMSLIMIGGYLLTDTFLYGWAGAIASIAGNIVQGAASIALGIAMLLIKRGKLNFEGTNP